MRRATLLLLMLVTMSSCSSSDTPSSQEQAASIAAGELSPADAAFEDFARSEGFADNAEDLEAVRDLAHTICDAYDSGASFAQIIAAAQEGGAYTEYEAGQLNGAATAAYCPEHATR